MTNVFAPTVCSGPKGCAITEDAGFYNSTASLSTFQIGQTGTVDNITMEGTVGAVSTLTGSANWMFDTVKIPFLNGVSGNSYEAAFPNFDMLVVSAAHETLPDGTTYPPQVGKLGLGAPEFNQSWLHFPPNPRWNGTLLPSSMFAQGLTTSISYGMHIGSPALGITGSLTIGGYDQSRALGVISSQAYSIDHLPIDLLDIGLGVAEGHTPLPFNYKSGLLAAGNSSIGVALSVLVEAPIPYIYLPKSTCDAITSYLPVTYQKKYGLYFWDVESPRYKLIVSSSAFLSFTFRLDGGISQNFTIKVPLALLNLTLTSPITTEPTAYLPLRPQPAPGGKHALGRAFLQAAFVGVNWQTALPGNGDGAWFLAQAPGPNTPSQNPATTIEMRDRSLIGSENDWTDSWKGAWTVLSDQTSSSNGSSSSRPGGQAESDAGGLSSAAIAGIVVGVVALLLLCAGVAFVFFRRRKRARHDEVQEVSYQDQPGLEMNTAHVQSYSDQKYTNSGFGPNELGTGARVSRPIEMEG